MPIRSAGLHLISCSATWKTGEKPDLAVENARTFFVGQPLMILPDGTIVSAADVSGIPVFDYQIDLKSKKGCDFLSKFKDDIVLDQGFFRVRDPKKTKGIKMTFVSQFGRQHVIVNTNGVLCIKSLHDHFNETNPMEGVPQT